MDLLKRELAPILSEAWQAIDAEASAVLQLNLAGRKLVDLEGPHGWEFAAVNTGRLDPLRAEPFEGVGAARRRVQPLVELRTTIVLAVAELDAVARGTDNPDLEPVVQAAQRMALAEDGAMFNGFDEGRIQGLIPASPHAAVPAGETADYPRAILDAQEILRKAGVNGPYALVLGTESYEDLMVATDEGYPVIKLVGRTLVDGPIVKSPAIEGAVVMSVRGGDYELTLGQDLAIGYRHHDREKVELFLTESFTFRVLEPAAAVRLERR